MSAEDTAASIAGAVVAGKALQVPTAELQECKKSSWSVEEFSYVCVRFIHAAVWFGCARSIAG